MTAPRRRNRVDSLTEHVATNRKSVPAPLAAIAEVSDTEIARWVAELEHAELVQFRNRLYTFERAANAELRRRNAQLREERGVGQWQ